MNASASPSIRGDLVLVLRGIAAGVLAGAAMNLYARAMAAATNGHEAKGAAPGGDRTGRGAQPAQAKGRADEDAAIRIGAIAYHALVHRKPTDRARPWLGSAAHYGFSASAGVCYALVAARAPGIRACFGTLYGTLVWALADEGVVPALGLSRRPTELPLGVHLYALCGHWIYGGTLEALTRPLLNAR
jgi:hypothetical protein